jgi:hypothetical protein
LSAAAAPKFETISAVRPASRIEPGFMCLTPRAAHSLSGFPPVAI